MPGAWPDSVDRLDGSVIRAMHAPVETKPADPTGVTGATALMLGLAVAFTPRRTGRVKLMVTGNVSDNTTADVASFILRFGTGAAPANQDAGTAGTAVTPTRTFTALTGMTKVPFSQIALINTPLIGTAYWFDYSAAATGGAAVANMDQLTFIVEEI